MPGQAFPWAESTWPGDRNRNRVGKHFRELGKLLNNAQFISIANIFKVLYIIFVKKSTTPIINDQLK